MFIQAFISKTPIEVLADSILHGLSRLDEMVLDAVLLAPLIEDKACTLGTVI